MRYHNFVIFMVVNPSFFTPIFLIVFFLYELSFFYYFLYYLFFLHLIVPITFEERHLLSFSHLFTLNLSLNIHFLNNIHANDR